MLEPNAMKVFEAIACIDDGYPDEAQLLLAEIIEAYGLDVMPPGSWLHEAYNAEYGDVLEIHHKSIFLAYIWAAYDWIDSYLRGNNQALEEAKNRMVYGVIIFAYGTGNLSSGIEENDCEIKRAEELVDMPVRGLIDVGEHGHWELTETGNWRYVSITMRNQIPIGVKYRYW